MKRNMYIAPFIIVLVAGLILTTLPKATIAQITSNNNNNNKPIIIHVHPHLNVTSDGKKVTVPAYIGIEPSLWKDHSQDQYGMRSMNMNMIMPGMAPLHTHDTSGIIHVESSVYRTYTLDEFLNNWGLNLNGKTVKATVDGVPVSYYKDIILRDGEQINLDVQK